GVRRVGIHLIERARRLGVDHAALRAADPRVHPAAAPAGAGGGREALAGDGIAAGDAPQRDAAAAGGAAAAPAGAGGGSRGRGGSSCPQALRTDRLAGSTQPAGTIESFRKGHPAAFCSASQTAATSAWVVVSAPMETRITCRPPSSAVVT